MRISDLAAAHDALAERFKTYEQVVDELPPVEVLNELRYALRAALELLALKEAAAPRHESTEKERELIARLDHALKCASHDLVDGLVIELGRFLRHLTDLPSTYEVVGSKFADIFADLQSAEKIIAQSRGDPANRSELYETKLYGKFEELSKHLRYLTRTAKPLIDQRQQAREQQQRRALWRWWAGIVAAASLGVLLTSLWNWFAN